MKKSILMLVLIISATLTACSADVDLPFIEEVDEVFTMTHNGIERTYYVYVPSEVEVDSPMLVMLHGYGSSIELLLERTDLREFADQDKVVLVFPEGTKALGFNHWNAHLRYEDVDDIDFLTSLTNDLIEEYQINEDLVFVGGHSNGGFMSYTLACEANNLYRAYMSVSGSMSGETWDTCDVEDETNIFQFHGTDDLIVPIDGSMTEMYGWGGAPEIAEMLNLWVNLLSSTTISTDDLTDELMKTTYLSATNHKVVYLKAIGYGHLWAQDGELFEEENDLPDMSELLWDYMMSFIE